MSLRYLPEAEREALSAAGWYNSRTLGKGHDFLTHLDSAADVIQRQPSSFPRIYPPRLKGEFRVHVLSRFQYSIVYQVRNGDQVVVAVAHHRRRAYYWTRRFKRT